MNSTRIHCQPFEAHPNTYITSIHILSVFSVITNSLAIYCIYAKSPPSMQNYKYHLLPYQTVAYFLDVLLCIFSLPVFFLPVPMGYPAGLFFYVSWNVHAIIMFCLGTIALMLYMTLELFFYRFQTALLPYSQLKLSTLTYYIVVAVGFVIGATPLIYNLSIMKPDLAQNLLLATQKYDCYDNLINLPRLYAYCINDILIGAIEFLADGFISIFSICIFVFLTYRSLSGSGYSNVHIKQQKRLLFYLCMQTIAPIFLVFIPFSYICVLVITGEPIGQDVINLCTSLICIHGLIGSICLLVVVGPYRRFVFGRVIDFFRKNSSEQPSNHNSVTFVAQLFMPVFPINNVVSSSTVPRIRKLSPSRMRQRSFLHL